ncbi:Alpha-protein kinase vwkA [Gracilariopsis chorda]|uniref:Alpha-protein kinase vwkA n=1 Tax=Gracilariopsis chorda TaxID=448386 RepID=A0A2V3IV11_9FLOR|nr:Alpha-protein kinase vwkA [Gracilariopsis chorda]|eukprot:PXF45929.1 Alpha-protein kinase vwkA [Gracilariopsis chorda]
MSDDIAAVNASANDIINNLDDNSADYRVAVVQYNDPSAGVVSSFSSDKSTITGAINSLRASGGGDTPEHVYSGLELALKLPWRPEATRTIIMMGDAPPKDPEPGTGLTQAKIVALANSVYVSVDSSPAVRQLLSLEKPVERMPATIVNVVFTGYVPLLMIPTGGSAATKSSFSALSSMTNGTVFAAASASEVVDALKKAVIKGAEGSASGVKPVERLILTSICWVTTCSHRVRIRNPNSFEVAYDWDVYRTSKKGTGTATAGDSFLVIEDINRQSTMRVFWKDENGGKKQTQKALNQKDC